MAHKRKHPIKHPTSFTQETFRLGEVEFPIVHLWDDAIFQPVKVKRRAVKRPKTRTIIWQSKEENALD